MKAKHQRLVLIVLALVALIGAGLLATYALRNQASYFYLPEQMAENPPEPGQAVRLGGMVEPGSMEMLSDGITVTFAVTGREQSRIPVRLPAYFRTSSWKVRVSWPRAVSVQTEPSWPTISSPNMTRITCPANWKA